MDICVVNAVTLRVKAHGCVYYNQDENPWIIIGLLMKFGGKCELLHENGDYLQIGQQRVKLDLA